MSEVIYRLRREMESMPGEYDGVPLACLPSPEDKRDYKYQHIITALGAPQAAPEAIDYRPNLPPVFNQGSRGTCHDDKTEVLTDCGWILFKDLTGMELLATVNIEERKILFTKPDKLFRIPYQGPMLTVEKRSLNFSVTPDHTMVVRKWDENKRTLSEDYSKVKVKDLGWYSGLPTGACNEGENPETYILNASGKDNMEIPMEPWLRLLGFFIADGTLYKDGPKYHYRIQLAAQKERKKEFVKRTLDAIGIHASEYSDRFSICKKSLWMELLNLGYVGCKAPFKFVPQFVFGLSPALIKEFLNGFFEGDGSKDGNSRLYYTSSKRLANELQILILLSGGWATICERKRENPIHIKNREIHAHYPEYKVCEWVNNGLSIERKKDVKEVYYDGIVYCAEISPCHTLITRRNGKILISGNCVSAAVSWTPKAFQEISQGDFPVSGLSAAYLYTMCKSLDGISGEEGTYPRIAMKILQQFGICPETFMPYSTLVNLAAPKVPAVPRAAKTAAEKYRIKTYAQLCAPGDMDRSNLLATIRQALRREGPFLLALLVTDSFRPGSDGKLPLPAGKVLGGHAVGIVGDLPDIECLILRNSWGAGWGRDGYALLPYEWLTRRYDYGWYVFEAWTAVDMVAPRAAKEIVITPDSSVMQVDGVDVYLDQPAEITAAGRMTLPVRALGGNVGYLVAWDGSKAVLTRPN